jgi:hypothetical protein
MPVTILSSDLAYAPVGGDRLTLHFDGGQDPPGYLLIRRDGDGQTLERLGPFEYEDQALEAAGARYGALNWSHH